MNNQIVRETRFRLSDAGGQMQDYGPGTSSIWMDAGMLRGVTPVVDLDAATKGYVDGRGTGGPTSDTAICWGTSAQGFGWIPCDTLGYSFANVGTSARGVAAVTPMLIGERAQTFDAMAVNVNSGTAAGQLMRLGVYSLNMETLAPLALLLDAGTVDTSSTGVKILVFATALVVAANTIGLGLASMLEGSATKPNLNGSSGNSDMPLLGKTDIDTNTIPSWANSAGLSDGALPTIAQLDTIGTVPSSAWIRRSA